MVSFVKTRGVRASLTVLVAALVFILLSVRFDDYRFWFFRFNQMAVTTHVVPTDEDRMEYNNYVSPMTTIEKFGKNEELRGGITKPQNDLRLRGLQDRSQTEGFVCYGQGMPSVPRRRRRMRKPKRKRRRVKNTNLHQNHLLSVSKIKSEIILIIPSNPQPCSLHVLLFLYLK
jgi:hypothetical protein